MTDRFTKDEGWKIKIENGENRLGVTSHLFAPTFAQNTLERRRWTSAKPRSVFFFFPFFPRRNRPFMFAFASPLNATALETNRFCSIFPRRRPGDVTFPPLLPTFLVPAIIFFPPLLPFVSFLPLLSISICAVVISRFLFSTRQCRKLLGIFRIFSVKNMETERLCLLKSANVNEEKFFSNFVECVKLWSSEKLGKNWQIWGKVNFFGIISRENGWTILFL